MKRRELRRDSGGAGEFRGGLGQTLELTVQGDRPFMFSGLYERIDHPAPGLHGGEAGAAGTLATNRPEIELRAKARVPLPAGTEITLGLPGGGGYGPPGAAIPPGCSRTSATATCRSSAPAPTTASQSTRSE